MRVEIGLPSETSNTTSDLDRPQIYLEGLKGYPDVRCQPEINGALAVFRLSLSDFYECGVTRMVNQLTVGGVLLLLMVLMVLMVTHQLLPTTVCQ